MPVPDKEKERLEEISTDEVSLVDHAANKKKFLVVKNHGGENMSDEKKGQTQDDETTEVVETEKVDDNPEATAEPTAVADVVEGAAADTDQKAAGKQQVEIAKMFEQIGTSLSSISKQLQSVVRQKQAPKPTEKATPDVEVVDEVAARAEEVEKAGAKISNKRLTKVVAAHKELTELLKDLNVLDKDGKPVSKSAEVVTPQEQEVDGIKIGEASLTALTKQLDDVSTQVKTVSESVEAIQSQSAQSKQPPNNSTEEPVEKAAGMWDNIL